MNKPWKQIWCYLFIFSWSSLSVIPGRGDGSPPRSSPGSSIGVLGRFDSGDLAMTPAAPGRVLGSVTQCSWSLKSHSVWPYYQ